VIVIQKSMSLKYEPSSEPLQVQSVGSDEEEEDRYEDPAVKRRAVEVCVCVCV